MTDPLAIYVHDHLAGAKFASELLREIREQHPEAPLNRFATEMLTEVEQDSAVLEDLALRLGHAHTGKKLAAWLAEKASRAKLRQDDESLGTFETLEVLALGILGKLSLWRALAFLSDRGDTRLQSLDLIQLIKRAEQQHAKAEAQRIACAQQTFHQPIVD